MPHDQIGASDKAAEAMLDVIAREMGMGEGSAEKDMVEGYLDGLKDVRPNLPGRATNRSRSYLHGWLNGRDDRVGRPRDTAENLRRLAQEAIREDERTTHE